MSSCSNRPSSRTSAIPQPLESLPQLAARGRLTDLPGLYTSVKKMYGICMKPVQCSIGSHFPPSCSSQIIRFFPRLVRHIIPVRDYGKMAATRCGLAPPLTLRDPFINYVNSYIISFLSSSHLFSSSFSLLIFYLTLPQLHIVYQTFSSFFFFISNIFKVNLNIIFYTH